MAGVNKVIILGRLGQDPEVRTTQGGQQVATLSVATSEKYTKDGKTEEKTEWHRLVAWGKTAELAGKYLKKGSQCYFEGKLQTRSWEDDKGVKRYTTEIVVSGLTFVDSGNRDGGNRPPAHDDSSAPVQHSQGAPAASSAPQHTPPDMDEDVPF